MLPLCLDESIAAIPWSPLARGRLTRDWNEAGERQDSDAYGEGLYKVAAAADRRVVEAVSGLAATRGIPRAQVALAWVGYKRGIAAPIIGAFRPQHLDDEIAALDVILSKEERSKIALVTGGSRGIGRAAALAPSRAGAGAGAGVIVQYSSSVDEARSVVSQIREAGGRAEAVQVNLQDADCPAVTKPCPLAYDAFDALSVSRLSRTSVCVLRRTRLASGA